MKQQITIRLTIFPSDQLYFWLNYDNQKNSWINYIFLSVYILHNSVVLTDNWQLPMLSIWIGVDRYCIHKLMRTFSPLNGDQPYLDIIWHFDMQMTVLTFVNGQFFNRSSLQIALNYHFCGNSPPEIRWWIDKIRDFVVLWDKWQFIDSFDCQIPKMWQENTVACGYSMNFAYSETT